MKRFFAWIAVACVAALLIFFHALAAHRSGGKLRRRGAR